VLKFIDFGQTTFRAATKEAGPPCNDARLLLSSMVCRPMKCCRTEIGWIAACTCRAAAKPDDLARLKWAKKPIDQRLMVKARELVTALISRLRGDPPADSYLHSLVIRPGQAASERGSLQCVGGAQGPDCWGGRGSTGTRPHCRGAMRAAKSVEVR
jgi:hypothetical protein